MKAWIEVDDDFGIFRVWIGARLGFILLGERRTHRGALHLAKRWAEYLGGLEVKDLTGGE